MDSAIRNPQSAIPKVALVRCPDYQWGRVLDAARRAFDLLGGLGRFVVPGQRVLVKPNLLSATPPERAVTTHPAVVRAAASLAREAGAQVWVGDSPGGVEWKVTARALEVSGIGPAAVEAGAEVLDFDAGDRQVVDLPSGAVLKRFAVARAALDADLVLSLPKLKTHGQTLYTGAVKNLLGCVPGGGKIRVHQLAPKSRDLAAALLDIYAVVRPRLALIDGIVAMEGNGPNHGDPRHLGLLIASDDCVAADAVACHLIGYPARSIHILRQAEERGLGVGSIDRIEIVGEPLERCRVPDFARASNLFLELFPPPLARLIGRAVRVDPQIDQHACRRCGLCQRSCPAHAIDGDGPFVIDLARCIRCFCCHELCPHDAVALRPSLLIRLYEWLQGSGKSGDR
jgi:uncharacterized protein (DUF362 family)/Pyruvate/2-oxoacid:ferredoxin oxidoreductase delta subunit